MRRWIGVCVVIALTAVGIRALPESQVIDVSTVQQLQAAVAALASGTTVRIAPGRYALTQELTIRNGVTNVALVGATGNRSDVVIVGTGMTTPGVNIAVKVENAQNVRIADLSIGQTYWHPIQLKGESGAERIHISNVRLFDAGEQFVKSTINVQAPNGVDDVIVERSLIEYTVIGPAHGYTEGIDVHHGANWIIRNNVFRNIRVPSGAKYVNRPAVLMWSGSRNSTVVGNTIINCERGIIFGQGGQSQYGNSHSGGLIANNFIYRTEPLHADAGISVWDSPGTRVYHNTVIQNGTYATAIEYRFATTTGVEIINNLTDGTILRRDGATAQVSSNFTQANPTFFVNAAAADLHLAATAALAIDRGVTLPAVTTDWDGQARPAGSAPDLGADELVKAPSPGVDLVQPAALQATVAGSSVSLSWQDASTGESEYVVERADARRDGFRVIAKLAENAATYNDADLSRGWYRYRVRAYASMTGQYSPYSNTAEARLK